MDGTCRGTTNIERPRHVVDNIIKMVLKEVGWDDLQRNGMAQKRDPVFDSCHLVN
jgi:hypothetical protein